MPPVAAFSLMGRNYVMFTTVESLQELYVTKNSQVTKYKNMRRNFRHIMDQSIILMDTDKPDYPEKRKALSGAFFKQKLQGITRIIKETTLDQIKQWQVEFGDAGEVDATQIMIKLYSSIIVNVSVGFGSKDIKVD